MSNWTVKILYNWYIIEFSGFDSVLATVDINMLKKHQAKTPYRVISLLENAAINIPSLQDWREFWSVQGFRVVSGSVGKPNLPAWGSRKLFFLNWHLRSAAKPNHKRQFKKTPTVLNWLQVIQRRIRCNNGISSSTITSWTNTIPIIRRDSVCLASVSGCFFSPDIIIHESNPHRQTVVTIASWWLLRGAKKDKRTAANVIATVIGRFRPKISIWFRIANIRFRFEVFNISA